MQNENMYIYKHPDDCTVLLFDVHSADGSIMSFWEVVSVPNSLEKLAILIWAHK